MGFYLHKHTCAYTYTDKTQSFSNTPSIHTQKPNIYIHNTQIQGLVFFFYLYLPYYILLTLALFSFFLFLFPAFAIPLTTLDELLEWKTIRKMKKKKKEANKMNR